MKDLTFGKERNVIIRFAIPMLLGNLFQQTYSLINAIIVGKLIGEEALAATGASYPIIFVLISFIIGVSTAGTIIVSQYFGAKDFDRVRKSIDTILIFALSSSILITVLGICVGRQIFILTNLPKEILPEATSYLNIFLGGTFLMFGFNGIMAILRGLGDSKTPLFFLIMATLLNILLDLLFVWVFRMGIQGAAIATVSANGIAFLAAALYLNKTHKLIQIRIRKMNFDWFIFRQSLRIGLPSGLQQTFIALGGLALYSIVNLFDTNVIAAYSVAGRIDSLAILPATTFGQSLSTFVGQNLGAGRVDRVKKGLRSTILISVSVSIGIALVIVLLKSALLHLFTNNQEVIFYGSQYLSIVCVGYIIFGYMASINGVMRGAGDTLIPMFITLFAFWIIRVPVAAIFSGRMYDFLLNWGFNVDLPSVFKGSLKEAGIWLSLPVSWGVGATCSTIYYFTGKWKKKRIVQQFAE